MNVYDRTWRACAAVVTAIGLFAAFRGFAATTLLGTFLTAAVLVVMWTLPFISADVPMVRPLVRAGLVGGLLTWVVMGAVRAVGPVGVPVVVVLLATSPPVVGWCARLLRGSAAPPPPESMSDAELCQAWRRSVVALRWATTPAAKLAVAELRTRYLDELERRSGPRFHAWLEGGARAAGDPSRLLESRDHDADHGSTAD